MKVLRELAEIERRFGLVRGEATSCRFDQNQIQEVLYVGLMPELRSEYHMLLGDAYIEREDIEEPDEADGEDAVFLAQHYLRGSKPKKGRPYLEAALDHLERSFQADAGRRVGATCPGRTQGADRRGPGPRIDADVLDARAARTPCGAGDRCAGRGPPQRRRRVTRSFSHRPTPRSPSTHGRRATTSGQSSTERAPSSAPPPRAMGGRKRRQPRFRESRLANLGRHDEASRTVREAVRARRGKRQPGARRFGQPGCLAWMRGRYDLRWQHHSKRLELAGASVDPRAIPISEHNLANVLLDFGLPDKSREHHERALATGRKRGVRVMEGLSHHGLGEIEERANNLEEAEKLYRAAVTAPPKPDTGRTRRTRGLHWVESRRCAATGTAASETLAQALKLARDLSLTASKRSLGRLQVQRAADRRTR